MSPNGIRLLALDGGGIRGLSMLMILQQLMETVNPDAPPKPCDYFDMIGGTSTGGLIAIMLGRLRMSVDDSIEAYLSLSSRVFKKKAHRITWKGKIRGRFDSEELARAVKEVISKQNLPEDTLLKEDARASCKVFVCATSKETSNTVCLASYRSPNGNTDLLGSVRIWESCVATAAASSFFDPIKIGRYKETFVDGATGANNPIWEVWNQAQQVWGPEPLEDKIKCVVSIGAGVLPLTPFKDDVYSIHKTLIAMATRTEEKSNEFRRSKPLLDDTGRYYRFNVTRGLGDIGLEETERIDEIAAATRDYIHLPEVLNRMQNCAGNLAGRKHCGKYKTVFTLEVPKVNKFVDRPEEMTRLERTLLPGSTQRQKISVLHGLGGMGKTQLAVKFTLLHQQTFSSVFWLNGESKSSLSRSIFECAKKIPQDQLPERHRRGDTGNSGDGESTIKYVMGWLANPQNTAWLLIFDNVDRKYRPQEKDADPEAYDVTKFFPGASHGSILITTRLASLEQLGDSQRLEGVDEKQARQILKNWYDKECDTPECDQLLQRLGGLPLAIAQAGAYLRETNTGFRKYLDYYDNKWADLMKTDDFTDMPLLDYPNRSIWTTWAISFDALHIQHEATAHLLLLWSFLDNKDLWHGLFANACAAHSRAAQMLSRWIGNIATHPVEFDKAMKLLRSYSLVEQVQDLGSYATHPVVHRWARHSQGGRVVSELSQLAIIVIGLASTCMEDSEDSADIHRLVPHAQVCFEWVIGRSKEQVVQNACGNRNDFDQEAEQKILMLSILLLPVFYAKYNYVGQEKQLYEYVLQAHKYPIDQDTELAARIGLLELYSAQKTNEAEKEKVLEKVTQGLETQNFMSNPMQYHVQGVVYLITGDLAMAEELLLQSIRGYIDICSPEVTNLLETMYVLAQVYFKQGKIEKAEEIFRFVLLRYEEAGFPPDQERTLKVLIELGNLYLEQGKLEQAEETCKNVLAAYEKRYGPQNSETWRAAASLMDVYNERGMEDEAEAIAKRVVQALEEAVGSGEAPPLELYTSSALLSLGVICVGSGQWRRAKDVYTRALRVYEVDGGMSKEDHCALKNLVTDLNRRIEQSNTEGPVLLVETVSSEPKTTNETMDPALPITTSTPNRERSVKLWARSRIWRHLRGR